MGQSQREDAEEDPRVADAEEAEQRRDRRRGEDAAKQKDFHGGDVQVLDDKGHSVGTHAEVGGVTEREEARIAQEKVEAEGGDREDQAVRKECDVVGRDQQREEKQDNGDRNRRE